jgi:hypothetical protein
MDKQDETLTTTTYTPHKEDALELWIFADSDFLPLHEIGFAGQVEKRSKAGTAVIPCLKFVSGEKKYFLSLWSKPNVPLPLASQDICRVYVNKDKKVEVLNLSTPKFS